MVSFMELTMGPLPPKACYIFSALSFIDLINILLILLLAASLIVTKHYGAAILACISIGVVGIRYLSTRMLFNMCLHKQ